MNKEESRILHGLYHDREIVDKNFLYKAEEINWLANTPLPKGKKWRGKDGKLQSLDIDTGDIWKDSAAIRIATERALSYLQASGYIVYAKGDWFSIAITGSGADIARDLDNWWGRTNLLYKNQKDGVLWLIATVLVSLITALIAR